MAKKQARALADGEHNGVAFTCNAVVEADAAVIALLENDGAVDSSKEAVAYAKSLSKQVVAL